MIHRELEIDELPVDQREYIEHGHDEPAPQSAHLFVVHEVNEVGLEIRYLLGGLYTMPESAALCADGAAALVVFKHLHEDLGRLFRGTLVFINDRECLAHKAFPFRRVAKETQCLTCQFLTIRHRDDGIVAPKERMDVFEIEHLIPDDDCLAVRRRLQDIMSPVGNEAAADVDDIAETVNAAKLSNGVQYDDVLAALAPLLEVFTCIDRKTGSPTEMFNLHRAQYLTRSDDEPNAGFLFTHHAECREYKFLLAAVRRTCDHDVTGARKPQFTDQLCPLIGADTRICLVEFCIARHGDKLTRRTKTHDIIRVDA